MSFVFTSLMCLSVQLHRLHWASLFVVLRSGPMAHYTVATAHKIDTMMGRYRSL